MEINNLKRISCLKKFTKKNFVFAFLIVVLISLIQLNGLRKLTSELSESTSSSNSTSSISIDYYDVELASLEFSTEINEPIDVVYTWVNGSDPEHQRLFSIFKSEISLVELRKVSFAEFYNISMQAAATKANAEASADSWHCFYKFCIQTKNIFIVQPKIDDLMRKKIFSYVSGRFEANFISNLTIDNEVDSINGDMTVTVISLNNYNLTASLTSLREFNILVNSLVIATGHDVYLGFYTIDCSFSSNCIVKDREFILKQTLPEANPPKFLIIKSDSDEMYSNLSLMIKTKRLANRGGEEWYRVNPASLSWDLGKPWIDGLKKNRFSDKNELKYSLRSLEIHAMWVRNIYIVTNGQVPSWLNLEHPRIRLVKHQDLFPNTSHLPTFNSVAIESHLHRIRNLSRRFLYFNDDCLLTAPTDYSDFYEKERQAYKLYFTRIVNTTLGENDICNRASEYRCSLRYVNRLFNERFENLTKRGVPPHMPFLIDRYLMEHLQSEFRPQFERTSGNRFRSPKDMQYSFSYFNFILSRHSQLAKMEASLENMTPNVRLLSEFNESRDYFVKCANHPLDGEMQVMCAAMFEVIRNRIRLKREMFNYVISNDTEEIKALTFGGKLKNIRSKFDEYLRMKRKFLCINDVIDYTNEKEEREISDIVVKFYETLFPYKSSFEA